MSEAMTSVRRGPIRLLVGMLVRPRTTLEYLKDHARRAWWLPAILAVLMVAAPVVVSGPIRARETRETILANQEEMAEQRGRALTEEQKEQIVSYGASPLITTVFPAVGGVAGLIASWLAWAGGLYLAGMALGGRSTFRTVFRTVVWTWLPLILRGLIQTVYILASDQTIAHPGLSGFAQAGRAVGELATAPPGLDRMLLVSFLSRVDLYMVWHLIVLFVGVRVVTQLSRRKTVLVMLVVWLVLAVLSIVPTIAGSYFVQGTGGG